MTETLSFGNPILQAWRPEADRRRWETVLTEAAGTAPHALWRFVHETREGLTSFIAELKINHDTQLLRPYTYELTQVDQAVANRETETDGMDGVHQRATATAAGIRRTHNYFRGHGDGSQAVLMSPVNEADGRPEFSHTALYVLTYEHGVVNGWQLFVDFSPQERKDYVARIARRAGAGDDTTTDLELAAHPVLSESSAKPLYNSLFEFVADIAQFRKNTRGRASISGISLEDPAGFIKNQLRLEAKNCREAERWVEPYIRAIAQGSIDLARRIITKLQLKALNLTESAVRAAARLTSVDFSALQVFLRACGFLSFSFSPETPSLPFQISLTTPISGGACQEKICRRCGTHAGDHDTTCPSCGWSP